MSTRPAHAGLWGRALAIPVVLVLSATLAACGSDEGVGAGSGDTSEVTDAQKELYEQAVDAGGKLNVFIGTGANEEIDLAIRAFHEQFPDISIEFVSGTGDEVTERLLTEKRAGLDNADVLAMAGLSGFERMDTEGYLADFKPEAIDHYAMDESTYLDNRAYAFANLYHAVCYNPANVTKDEIELLQTFDGWTDPVFEGRAAIVNAKGFGYRRALLHAVYQDENLGKEWLAGLAKLKPTVYTSANVAGPQVIAGEYDVLFNAMMQHGVRAYDSGAPMECATGEYAPYFVWLASVVKDAPNPAAAELFADWLFTEAGQRAVQTSFAWSARHDEVTEPLTEAGWWHIPDDIRADDESLVETKYDELVTTFDGLFGNAKES